MTEKRLLTLHDKSQVAFVNPDKEHSVLAKLVEYEDEFKGTVSVRQRYWLKTVANRLINPIDYSLYELKKNDGRFIEVNKELYDTYHKVINNQSAVPLRSLETRVLNA